MDDWGAPEIEDRRGALLTRLAIKGSFFGVVLTPQPLLLGGSFALQPLVLIACGLEITLGLLCLTGTFGHLSFAELQQFETLVILKLGVL